MSDIIVLCEDRQMSVFARHFLACRFDKKFASRQITSLPCPKRCGSGEQWVRKEFPRQVEAVRKRQRAILVVMIDADSGSTANRRKQLDRECQNQSVSVPTKADRVLIAVPKRNIETWFAYLNENHHDVNEIKRYPKFRHENDCKPLANKLYHICHVNQKPLPRSAPASLRETCQSYGVLKRNR